MGAGSYTIPMSEYYSKSKSLKDSVTEVTESVQSNFFQKISDNISELDSQDQSFLEGCSAYTSAKKLYTKLTETHMKNLNNMSSFNGQNPLYAIENNDKEFASQFNAIANGTNSAEVTNRLNSLNQTITNKYSAIQFDKFYDSISEMAKGVLDSNEYSRLMAILKLNPKKAMESLANSPDFLKLLEKSPKFRNAFAGFLASAAMFIEANPASKTAVEVFTKAGGFLKKVDGWISPALKRDLLSYASKLKEPLSKLGKVLPGPWGMLGIEIGLKGARNFFSDKSETKGKIGQSITDAGVDAIFNVGPIDGFLLGATTGNVGVAVIGGIAGGVNQITKFFWPEEHANIKNSVKKGARVVGKVIDDGIDAVGNGIKSAWSGIKNWFNVPKVNSAQVANSWFS
ncbi:hypothetical protein [Enterococcus ureasiticus]|uniref:LXG domain-containing protein n=1 Tax=Enterococcus ureasiticus TaxID=903984 RepID=A0A1E5GCL2_9ENTE|nr:hypothetical protein [Enterococcus ureasiticus]OEG10419.1 hypothetical protein BCR21_13820 [Enterococcus ureasiticus]